MRFIQLEGGEHGPPKSIPSGAIRLVLVMALALTASLPTPAKADSIEINLLSVVGGVGGPYTWSYSVVLTPGNFVSDNVAGDVVGIFDIDGYHLGSATFTDVALAPAGPPTYVLVSEVDGGLNYAGPPYVTGAPPGFIDDDGGDAGPAAGAGALATSIMADLHFDYVGASFANAGLTNVILGILSFVSDFNTADTDAAFTSDTALGSLPPGTGRWQEIFVPRSGGISLVPMPTASAGGMALLGLVGSLRMRRRDAVQ
jgi:MYXO-CTERM domain-containing protein